MQRVLNAQRDGRSYPALPKFINQRNRYKIRFYFSNNESSQREEGPNGETQTQDPTVVYSQGHSSLQRVPVKNQHFNANRSVSSISEQGYPHSAVVAAENDKHGQEYINEL